MKIVIVYSPPCSSKHLCIFCSVEHRNRNVKIWLVYMNTIVVHSITMNGFWSFQTCKSTMKVTHKSCALAIWVTTQICKIIIPIIFVIWNNELIQKSDSFTNLTWLPFSWPLKWLEGVHTMIFSVARLNFVFFWTRGSVLDVSCFLFKRVRVHTALVRTHHQNDWRN